MKWKKELKKWLQLGKERDSGWTRGDIIEVSPRWQKALVLICADCGERLNPSDRSLHGKAWAEGLRRWLKMKLVQDFAWGKKVRVVTTQCLDVCPKGKMTVVLANNQSGLTQRVLLVHPILHRKQIYEKIKSLF